MYINIGPYKDDGSDQDIEIRIDNYDCWNLDHTLARIIHAALVKFRENLDSYPSEFADPQTVRTSDDGFLQWQAVLDIIITSFHMILETDIDVPFDEKKHWMEKIHEGLILFAKHYMDLWD